jgi:hypothetical protein
MATAAKWFSSIHAVAKGIKDSQKLKASSRALDMLGVRSALWNAV